MTAPETIAIVPVKALGEAKSRLAAVLATEARRRLVLAMFGDVLAALAAAPAVTRTLVVTADPDVAAVARASGAGIVHEDAPRSLNGALRTALHVSQSHADIRHLILPADVPLATPDEVGALLADGPTAAQGPAGASWHRVVIAPSHDGGGTNALVLVDQHVMGPSFGPDSFQRHLHLAQALSLNPRVVRLAGLGFDIDTPEDLRRLSQVERYRWLQEAWLQEPHAAVPRAHQSA